MIFHEVDENYRWELLRHRLPITRWTTVFAKASLGSAFIRLANAMEDFSAVLWEHFPNGLDEDDSE